MREIIVVILLFLFAVVSAFEAGYILRDCQKDDTREIAMQAREKARDVHGRVVVLEGPPPKAQAKPGNKGH